MLETKGHESWSRVNSTTGGYSFLDHTCDGTAGRDATTGQFAVQSNTVTTSSGWKDVYMYGELPASHGAMTVNDYMGYSKYARNDQGELIDRLEYHGVAYWMNPFPYAGLTASGTTSGASVTLNYNGEPQAIIGTPVTIGGGIHDSGLAQFVPPPPPYTPLDTSGAAQCDEGLRNLIRSGLSYSNVVRSTLEGDHIGGGRSLLGVLNAAESQFAVYDRLRDQKNGMIWSHLTATGVTAARITGVENFSYFWDNTDPVTAQEYTFGQRMRFGAFGSIQLVATASGIRAGFGATGTSVRVFSSSSAMGEAAALAKPLTSAQRNILSSLSTQNSSVIVPRNLVNMRDLRNLTLHTGDEFAMLTRGPQRMIIRGAGGRVQVPSEPGWRMSGHTHPPGSWPTASSADMKSLEKFGQEQSAIWGSLSHSFNKYGPKTITPQYRYGF